MMLSGAILDVIGWSVITVTMLVASRAVGR
jgi:hypothetical protein